jgi:hypothetical protein
MFLLQGMHWDVVVDFIVACMPEEEGSLHGDKAGSVVLDNSKIKRFVPDYVATCRYRDGIKKSIVYYDADPARQLMDEAANSNYDKLISAYQSGLDNARQLFSAR